MLQTCYNTYDNKALSSNRGGGFIDNPNALHTHALKKGFFEAKLTSSTLKNWSHTFRLEQCHIL